MSYIARIVIKKKKSQHDFLFLTYHFQMSKKGIFYLAKENLRLLILSIANIYNGLENSFISHSDQE